jgi:hypothetical protein
LFRLFRNGLKIPKQTETNRNKHFLVSRNKPKINRNRFCFGFFRFEPKFFFVCFENTLVRVHLKKLDCYIISLGIAKPAEKINPKPHKKVGGSATPDKTPHIVRSFYGSGGRSGPF